MSDKFSNHSEYQKGTVGIDAWMRSSVLGKPSLDQGPKILCQDINGKETSLGLNRVGVLFKGCKMMRAGTNANYGPGGSNCITGTPVCFVDFVSVFPKVFSSSREGILASCEQPCFILPLCQLGSAKDLVLLMNEAYAEFVAQRKGNTKHDITHVANGICAGYAATCFALCQEITLNGKKPNVERMKFLVEAMYCFGLTARSVAEHSPECRKIFTLMPYVANTADTFQSTLMSFTFDETPCESIRVKQVGSSIFRHFNHSGWNTSYIVENPVGLIGLLLVVPMLVSLLTSELETSEIINQVIGAINNAITQITTEFQTTNFRALALEHNTLSTLVRDSTNRIIHIQNKQILRGFAKATKIPLVTPDQVDAIYDAVLAKEKDVAGAIGVASHAEFVQFFDGFTLNGTRCGNYPILIKTDRESKLDEKQDVGYSATYIPAEPREWTALGLRPGAEYQIEAKTLGLADFKSGTTVGEQNVANFRFTAGSEILKGLFPGYAATGMCYRPDIRRFVEADVHHHIDPNKPFTIFSGPDGVLVSQNGENVLLISNKGFPELAPTLCFKYCTINIKLIKLVETKKSAITVTSEISFADMARGGVAASQTSTASQTPKTEIDSCLSLTESLGALRVTGKARTAVSARKATSGQHSWGQGTANKLKTEQVTKRG